MKKNFSYLKFCISDHIPVDTFMIKCKNMQKNNLNFIMIVFFGFLFQLMIGCQTGKQSVVSDYRIQMGDLESIIQSGNWLKFYTERRAEPYTGTLNPGKMISSGREYHIVKFEYRDQYLPYSLQDGDTLSLILDGRALNLTGYNTSRQKNRLSAYYNIDKWDLVDIGNASSVMALIKAQEGDLRATFSTENIYNYRFFAAKYILGANDIPPISEPVYEQPIAFLSGGAGSGFDFWFGYYTNFLSIEPGLGDYLAAGMGFITFTYSRFNRFPGQGYLWDGNFSEKNYSINVMYGLTHPSPFGNWSFEIGFTYQYYSYDNDWNSENTGTDQFPTYYRLDKGKPIEGSVIGMFIQAGGLWVQFNRKRNWAVGIAIPVPWW
jgi:hypothetical protein